MTCHNAKTGEEVYGKQRFAPKGSLTASPWAYNGKVFCLSEEGLTYVIKAGDKFEILNTNPLDELCIATPSIANGKLLIRTLTKVYCITQVDASATIKDQKSSAIVQTPWLDPVIFRDLKHETANGPPAEFDGVEQTNELFGEAASDVLAKLRALPVEDVLQKFKQRWPVTTDGYVFPTSPLQIFARGEQHDVPTIVGTNRDEGTMFAAQSEFGSVEDFKAAVTTGVSDASRRQSKNGAQRRTRLEEMRLGQGA